MSKVQKNKPRLGRGLSSLISVSDLPVETEIDKTNPPSPSGDTPAAHLPSQPPSDSPAAADGQPLNIPLEAIQPNPYQPRKVIDDATIAELAASLKSTGLIQPIIVRRDDHGGYQLIAGERRWRAAKVAGFDALPAIVRDVDGYTQAQMALIENIQREDLNPIDRALGYQALMQHLGLTQGELAGRLGEDRSTIANFLRLLDLAEPVRKMLREGRLSSGHAKLLAGVPDLLEQERLANLIINQELSVRNLERLLQQDGGATVNVDRPEPSAYLKNLEQSITRQLGMRCQVRSGARKGRGRLIIHYNSLDEFDDLLGRLDVQAE